MCSPSQCPPANIPVTKYRILRRFSSRAARHATSARVSTGTRYLLPGPVIEEAERAPGFHREQPTGFLRFLQKRLDLPLRAAEDDVGGLAPHVQFPADVGEGPARDHAQIPDPPLERCQ